MSGDLGAPAATPRPRLGMRHTLLPGGLGLLAALGIALVLSSGWMGAPHQDVANLLIYLVTSGLISVGFGAAVLVWLQRGKVRLWLQVTLTYMLGVGIALFNIFLTARLMFISEHDLPLLVLLILCAAVISLGLGYALAQALARRVTALHHGAQALAEGDLAARVPHVGNDELAALAREFNQLAAQLAASAAERERMEAARRNLVAAISHDLRTPLTSLRAMTEALSDGLVDDPATTSRYLATMRNQIGHISTLIDDLFELAQIDAGALSLELQRVAAGDLISDTVEAMQPQAAARGIQLHGHVAPDLPPLLIAPQKIERVLYNLVGNAIRHTPAGGTITLTVGQAGPAYGPAQRALVEVSDTGEGIAAADLPHVFEQFYRGEKSRSRATGGAGLGLAIARGIVEAHGGTIWIESAGQGTTVRLLVPLAGG